MLIGEKIEDRIILLGNQIEQIELTLKHWLNIYTPQEGMSRFRALLTEERHEEQLNRIHDSIQAAMKERKMYNVSRNTLFGHDLDIVTAQAIRGFAEDLVIDSSLPANTTMKLQTRRFPANSTMRRIKWKKECYQFYNIDQPTTPNSSPRECAPTSSRWPFLPRQWCTINHHYHVRYGMKIAHIFGDSELNARYIFGVPDDESDGHRYNVRNCIPMLNVMKNLFDYHRIVIIPAEMPEPGSHPKLIVRVLDRALLPKGTGMWKKHTYADLDGRELKFKDPTNRPDVCYLYWAYCTALFRNQGDGLTTWGWNIKVFADRRFWTSSGQGWYRHSTFSAVAKKLGRIQDVYTFLETENLPTTVDDDEGWAEADQEVADEVRAFYRDKKKDSDGDIDSELDYDK